jgi:ribose-phosphate pyrophosphokinase
MAENDSTAILFTGSSHPCLAEEVANLLGVKLGQMVLDRFPDGEISLQIMENVRGRDVFVMQSVALDPNNYLMELLIMIDSLKRASAQSIAVVLPYYGYCRQDRKDRPRVPITAKLVANLLQNAGANRVLTMDLHTDQLQGFFDIPVDNLYARPSIIDAVRQDLDVNNLVVVTPDIGSVKLAKAFARQLGVDFAIVDKHRCDSTHVKVVTLIGDVKGKDVLLADDMCSTAGTLVSAAKVCQEKGANRIYAAVTHGLFVGDAVHKIEKSPIEVLYMSNTIPYTKRFENSTKFHSVSVANLFAKGIRCILSRESISSLFQLDSCSEPSISHS